MVIPIRVFCPTQDVLCCLGKYESECGTFELWEASPGNWENNPNKLAITLQREYVNGP